jgi:prephenate dehydrogenase
MKLFNSVAIVGPGLIGGSLGLAIKKKQLSNEVIGVSRRKKTLLFAKRIHAIDKGSLKLNAIKEADLVILATPVSVIMSLAPRILKIIRPNAIVTDVGSTKEKIVLKLEEIFPNYVGSHPLAGSEKRGILNAHPGIFKDSLCILTPTKNTNLQALIKIKRFWKELGTRVVVLSPSLHDKALSFVSHLAHIVAFSLIDTVPARFLKFASTGLKDTTRIAGSDSEIWQDIFLSNQKNILKTIDAFQANMSKIKSGLKRKDARLLSEILNHAKKKREILG